MCAMIAVDLDDTVYSFTTLARNVLASRAANTGDERLTNAAYALWPEWRTPVDLLGLDLWLDVIAECHSDQSILNQIPYPGVKKTLQELVERGHKVIYLSSRNETCEDATVRWLDMHHMPEGVLTCTGHDKAEYLAECQYVIDDRPSTLVSCYYDCQTYSSSYNHKRTLLR